MYCLLCRKDWLFRTVFCTVADHTNAWATAAKVAAEPWRTILGAHEVWKLPSMGERASLRQPYLLAHWQAHRYCSFFFNMQHLPSRLAAAKHGSLCLLRSSVVNACVFMFASCYTVFSSLEFDLFLANMTQQREPKSLQKFDILCKVDEDPKRKWTALTKELGFAPSTLHNCRSAWLDNTQC